MEFDKIKSLVPHLVRDNDVSKLQLLWKNICTTETNEPTTMEGIMILLILLCSSFCSLVQSSNYSKNNGVAEPRDVTFLEHALKSILFHQQQHGTGTLHEVKLPANLSGMHVSYVRVRSNTLWRKGANFSSFQIPSRTLPMPYVKRIVLLYEDFGNLSSQFYINTVPGYSIVSSVVGFKVYDASNLVTTNFRMLDFNTSDAPISVHFPGLKFPRGAKCAFFGGSSGEVSLVDMSVGNVCYSRSCGWFSVVIPNRKKGRVWVRWVIGAGFMTILLVIFAGMLCLKIMKVKRSDEIEMQMENGSVDLETVWIGYNKMPCATVTRTDPNLENGGLTS